MAEDLYKTWLGIRSEERDPDLPPDHYLLLGLPRFCHHPKAIEEAARRRLETLDKYAIHPDKSKRDMATRMMNEVATARVALNNPQTRQIYDRNLADQLGIRVPDKEVPPPRELLPMDDDSMLELNDLAPPPADQGDVAPLDESLREADAPEIRVEVDLTAPRTKNVAPIPFKVVLIAGGVLSVLVVIIVVVIVALVGKPGPGSGGSETARGATTVPAETPTEGAGAGTDTAAAAATRSTPPPPPIPVEAPDVAESFRSSTLDETFRIRGSLGFTATIVDSALRLELPSGGELRVEYTPRQTQVPFQRVQFRLRMLQDATFTTSIASGSLRLELARSPKGVAVRAQPGYPAGPVAETNGAWPVIDLQQTELLVTALRKTGGVEWSINGQLVATSPDILPRDVTSLRLVFTSDQPATATIDDVQVWYVKEK